ncbi:hypothetical protein K438DRAFT_1851412, partial [Mycena galopus ATCC 62051]
MWHFSSAAACIGLFAEAERINTTLKAADRIEYDNPRIYGQHNTWHGARPKAKDPHTERYFELTFTQKATSRSGSQEFHHITEVLGGSITLDSRIRFARIQWQTGCPPIRKHHCSGWNCRPPRLQHSWHNGLVSTKIMALLQASNSWDSTL